MPKKDFVIDNDTKNVKNYSNDIYEYQMDCSQENDEHSENKILNYIYDVFDNKFKDHINKMHEDSFLFSLDNDKSNSFLDSIQNNIGENKDIKIYKKYENQDFEKYHESNIPNHFEQIEENKKNNNFDYSLSQNRRPHRYPQAFLHVPIPHCSQNIDRKTLHVLQFRWPH